MIEHKQYVCHPAAVGVHIGVGLEDEGELTGDECRDLLNELTSTIETYKKESDNYNQYLNRVANTLINNYNYAQNQCDKNLDDVILYSAYKLLEDTIISIAKELRVDLDG